MQISEAKIALNIDINEVCTAQLIEGKYKIKYNDINHRIENALNDTIRQDWEIKLKTIEQAKDTLLSSLNPSVENLPSPNPNIVLDPRRPEPPVLINSTPEIKNYEKLNKYIFGLMVLGVAFATFLGIKLNSINDKYKELKPIAEKNQKIVTALHIEENELSIKNQSEKEIFIAEMNVLLMSNDSTLEVKNFTSKDIKDNGILPSNGTWEPKYNQNGLEKPIKDWIQVSIVGISEGEGCYTKSYTASDVENSKILFKIQK